ncbi:MAG: hypothetical protein KatS3mg003_2272 [Candidatus Nitrosocaldaceae archaeon]|nr:MAG: hypothetical protein KatS3mg003_2272 [Candidatus Nitrosocaldaceae archaeon]
MDKIDVDIIRLLLNDSRVSYNQIADRLGVSINTVRSRIDKMLKQGLIKYHTIVNLDKFGYTLIYILIRYDNLDKLIEKLSVIGKVIMIVQCLGDTFMIGLAIKDKDNPLELVKAFIEPYNASILFFKEPTNIRLSKNGLRIIKYLLNNPRVKSKDIADALDISTKTVKRVIDYLLKNGIIGFSIIMNPSRLEKYTNFGLIIKINDNTAIKRIYDMLEEHFLLSPLIYNNVIITVLYGESMQIIDEYYRKVKQIEGVNSVDLVIPLSVEINTNIL